MIVILKRHTPDPDMHIEECSRTCYDSVDKMSDKPNVEFIRSLIRKGHLSVLEHAVATFELDEISRALSHQLVRHRIASYSQRSQRYTKMKSFRDEGQYVMPISICGNEALKFPYHDFMDDVQDMYGDLLNDGIPAEDARMVLPNAAHTNIIMTMNFNSWRHFLDLRGDKHAQWEIRAMAIKIWKELVEISPACFGDYRIVGDCLVRPQYVSPDAIIYYQGQEFILRDLVDVYEKAKDYITTRDDMLR